jgi:hypothetical protein
MLSRTPRYINLWEDCNYLNKSILINLRQDKKHIVEIYQLCFVVCSVSAFVYAGQSFLLQELIAIPAMKSAIRIIVLAFFMSVRIKCLII